MKDRSGFPQTPAKASAFLSPQNEHDIVALTRKNLELESQLESLKRDHEESALDCENAYTAVAKLEKALEEKGLHIEAIASENDKLKEVNIDLTTKLEEKNLALAGLELSNKSARLVSDKFNNEIIENREAFQLEKTAIIKDFKAQIKIWRKDLGEERREKDLHRKEA